MNTSVAKPNMLQRRLRTSCEQTERPTKINYNSTSDELRGVSRRKAAKMDKLASIQQPKAAEWGGRKWYSERCPNFSGLVGPVRGKGI